MQIILSNQGHRKDSPQPPSHSTNKSQARLQDGAQRFPSLQIPYGEPGWQAICNRGRPLWMTFHCMYHLTNHTYSVWSACEADHQQTRTPNTHRWHTHAARYCTIIQTQQTQISGRNSNGTKHSRWPPEYGRKKRPKHVGVFILTNTFLTFYWF